MISMRVVRLPGIIVSSVFGDCHAQNNLKVLEESYQLKDLNSVTKLVNV